ncbi:MAG: hypothetical protein WD712_03325 [Candidatus Spechtbacterales bacterium]
MGLNILDCAGPFECGAFVALTLAPQIIGAILVTGIFVFIMDRMGKKETLLYKILKISLRAEEALLLIVAVWILLALVAIK